jgi:hypothetical protein
MPRGHVTPDGSKVARLRVVPRTLDEITPALVGPREEKCGSR